MAHSEGLMPKYLSPCETLSDYSTQASLEVGCWQIIWGLQGTKAFENHAKRNRGRMLSLHFLGPLVFPEASSSAGST